MGTLRLIFNLCPTGDLQNYKNTNVNVKIVLILVSISSSLAEEPFSLGNYNFQAPVTCFQIVTEYLAPEGNVTLTILFLDVEATLKIEMDGLIELVNQRHNRLEQA